MVAAHKAEQLRVVRSVDKLLHELVSIEAARTMMIMMMTTRPCTYKVDVATALGLKAALDEGVAGENSAFLLRWQGPDKKKRRVGSK